MTETIGVAVNASSLRRTLELLLIWSVRAWKVYLLTGYHLQFLQLRFRMSPSRHLARRY